MGNKNRSGAFPDWESMFFWNGLRSCIFHMSAQSEDCARIKKAKSLLIHPAMCYTMEEVSCADAAMVMDRKFEIMREDAHCLRVWKMSVRRLSKSYSNDVAELLDSVGKSGGKLYRFKVLIDADRIDRRSAREVLEKLMELRLS